LTGHRQKSQAILNAILLPPKEKGKGQFGIMSPNKNKKALGYPKFHLE
jgi:hypothetical protein